MHNPILRSGPIPSRVLQTRSQLFASSMMVFLTMSAAPTLNARASELESIIQLVNRGTAAAASTGFSTQKCADNHQMKTVTLKADDEPQHCKDLWDTICKGKAGTPVKEIRALEKEVRNEFKTRYQQVYGKAYRESAVLAGSSKDVEDATKTLEEVVFKRMNGKPEDMLTVAQEVREQLAKAIQSQNGISGKTKSQLLSKLNGIAFILPRLYAKHETAEFKRHCGLSDLKVNALLHGNNLTLCPGHVLDAISRTGSPEEAREMLKTILAHEFGHSIDTAFQPALFQPVKDCLTTHYGNQLYSVQGSKESENQNILHREVVADLWSIESQAMTYSSKGLSPEEVKLKLTQSYGPHCDSIGGADHPTSVMRVKILLGRNRRMRELLGCQPVDKKNPSCGFDTLSEKDLGLAQR